MTESKTYFDACGRRCRVMPGLGGDDVFKAHCQKSGAASWQGASALSRRSTLKEYQTGLYRMARVQGWEEEP